MTASERTTRECAELLLSVFKEVEIVSRALIDERTGLKTEEVKRGLKSLLRAKLIQNTTPMGGPASYIVTGRKFRRDSGALVQGGKERIRDTSFDSLLQAWGFPKRDP